MALHGKTPGKIRAAVKALKPFRIGNVSGTTEISGYGRLPEEHAKTLREYVRDGRVIYVLYSYSTPMAWAISHPDGSETWFEPNVKYSVTTSGHQSNFRYAIAERERDFNLVSV